jgi:hypothetical protein
VLLERSRAAELATAAHPVLADGPAVLTLLETITTALVARGLDPDATAAGRSNSPGRRVGRTTSPTSASPQVRTAAPRRRSTTPRPNSSTPNSIGPRCARSPWSRPSTSRCPRRRRPPSPSPRPPNR